MKICVKIKYIFVCMYLNYYYCCLTIKSETRKSRQCTTSRHLFNVKSLVYYQYLFGFLNLQYERDPNVLKHPFFPQYNIFGIIY